MFTKMVHIGQNLCIKTLLLTVNSAMMPITEENRNPEHSPH